MNVILIIRKWKNSTFSLVITSYSTLLLHSQCIRWPIFFWDIQYKTNDLSAKAEWFAPSKSLGLCRPTKKVHGKICYSNSISSLETGMVTYGWWISMSIWVWVCFIDKGTGWLQNWVDLLSILYWRTVWLMVSCTCNDRKLKSIQTNKASVTLITSRWISVSFTRLIHREQ